MKSTNRASISHVSRYFLPSAYISTSEECYVMAGIAMIDRNDTGHSTYNNSSAARSLLSGLIISHQKAHSTPVKMVKPDNEVIEEFNSESRSPRWSVTLLTPSRSANARSLACRVCEHDSRGQSSLHNARSPHFDPDFKCTPTDSCRNSKNGSSPTSPPPPVGARRTALARVWGMIAGDRSLRF